MTARRATPPPDLLRSLANPKAQRAFPWAPQRWISHLGDLPGVAEALDALPPNVDRETSRVAVERHLARDNIVGAFTAAMVWGYGETGYGPTRTRWVLSGSRDRSTHLDETVPAKLATGASVANRSGAVEGYRYLNNEGRIWGLGPAFFTKWLYFTTRGTAPILDAQVMGWLRREAGVNLRQACTHDYAAYIDVLTEWGHPLGSSAAEVEQAIFVLATGRG